MNLELLTFGLVIIVLVGLVAAFLFGYKFRGTVSTSITDYMTPTQRRKWVNSLKENSEVSVVAKVVEVSRKGSYIRIKVDVSEWLFESDVHPRIEILFNDFNY